MFTGTLANTINRGRIRNGANMGSLIEDLLKPGYELRETHISWVFLHNEKVYKVKRPVNLGFVDFSTLAQRRWACEQEISLNRRLAPTAYLGIIPITLSSDGVHHIDGEGNIVDWAVCMRRLPDEQRADLLLAKGELSTTDIDRIAATITQFHTRARTDAEISRNGLPEQITKNVRGNFGKERPAVRAYLTDQEGESLQSLQLQFIEKQQELLLFRVHNGYIRDGHGDLKAEHFYLEDQQVTVLDCVEFSTAFRCCDVVADLAYLSMELRASGQPALAERLLGQYALLSGDYQLYELIDFYEAYRASVRASVAAILAQDEDAPKQVRHAAHAVALLFFQHLLASQKASSQPTLFVVAGMIASGKSSISERLGARTLAPVLSSDWTRKELAGVSPTTPFYDEAFSDHYGPTNTDQVYEKLMSRAQTVLSSGRSVIVDASFRTHKQREQARQLALSSGAQFHLIECRVTEQVARQRLRTRSKKESVSDGRQEIYEQFLKKWEAITELPGHQHTVLNTAENTETQLKALCCRLQSPASEGS